jgi:hypothetical protein
MNITSYRRQALADRPYCLAANLHQSEQHLIVFPVSCAQSCRSIFLLRRSEASKRRASTIARSAILSGFPGTAQSLARFAGEQLAKTSLPFYLSIFPVVAVPCGCPIGSSVPTPALPVPILLHATACKQVRVCLSRSGFSLKAQIRRSRSPQNSNERRKHGRKKGEFDPSSAASNWETLQ